jgi:hypothetical protein
MKKNTILIFNVKKKYHLIFVSSEKNYGRGKIHTLFSNLNVRVLNRKHFAIKEAHKNQWMSWKIINIQLTAVHRITRNLENIRKQVNQRAYTWQPVVNQWLVQNICLVFSPTISMVVKLVSLIKLAESNGKHQQPNPIRKKGYGWK